jgi:flavin reductase
MAMGDALDGDFRKAMRTLASAVSIISTADGDGRFGMTATAVCSLSAQPPALLVCINQSASLHRPLLAAGRFCVNTLHADQDELARIFSRQAIKDQVIKDQVIKDQVIKDQVIKDQVIEDRFARGDWKADDYGVPFLAGAQASVFCAIEDSYSHRTHSIVIGAVYRASVRDRVHPLLYQDGRYTVGLADGVDWVIPAGH